VIYIHLLNETVQVLPRLRCVHVYSVRFPVRSVNQLSITDSPAAAIHKTARVLPIYIDIGISRSTWMNSSGVSSREPLLTGGGLPVPLPLARRGVVPSGFEINEP
jgi:hypothetical protein